MQEKLISFQELEKQWEISRQTLFRYAKALGFKRTKEPAGSYFKYSLTENQVKELEAHRDKMQSIGQRPIQDLDIDSYLKTAFGEFGSKKF